MRLDEVLELADKEKIDFLDGNLLAAIWAIDSTAGLDRKNPQAVAAHNAAVLAAQATIDSWMKGAGELSENRRDFLRDADLRGVLTPSPSSSTAFRALPGVEGHTHPIEPENQGTGLLRQGKTPRYDNWGHVKGTGLLRQGKTPRYNGDGHIT